MIKCEELYHGASHDAYFVSIVTVIFATIANAQFSYQDTNSDGVLDRIDSSDNNLEVNYFEDPEYDVFELSWDFMGRSGFNYCVQGSWSSSGTYWHDLSPITLGLGLSALLGDCVYDEGPRALYRLVEFGVHSALLINLHSSTDDDNDGDKDLLEIEANGQVVSQDGRNIKVEGLDSVEISAADGNGFPNVTTSGGTTSIDLDGLPVEVQLKVDGVYVKVGKVTISLQTDGSIILQLPASIAGDHQGELRLVIESVERAGPDSEEFWDAYPNYDTHSPTEVWEEIGRNIEEGYGGENSCAARVSAGLNGTADHKIPSGAPGANKNFEDGNRYIISARQMGKHLEQTLGAPDRIVTTSQEIETIRTNLEPNQIAIAVSVKPNGHGHAGIVKGRYADGVVDAYAGLYGGKVWILKK